MANKLQAAAARALPWKGSALDVRMGPPLAGPSAGLLVQILGGGTVLLKAFASFVFYIHTGSPLEMLFFLSDCITRLVHKRLKQSSDFWANGGYGRRMPKASDSSGSTRACSVPPSLRAFISAGLNFGVVQAKSNSMAVLSEIGSWRVGCETSISCLVFSPG